MHVLFLHLQSILILTVTQTDSDYDPFTSKSIAIYNIIHDNSFHKLSIQHSLLLTFLYFSFISYLYEEDYDTDIKDNEEPFTIHDNGNRASEGI